MNQLTKFLVDGILNEDKGEVIALYAGGFKPPTKGHFTVVEEALKQYPEIDKLIVLVGGGVRDGIEQAESILVWEIYQNYLPMKVEIQPSKKPPVGAVYSYAKNNPEDTVYWILGARDGKDEDLSDIATRTAAIDKAQDKYNNVEVKIITTPDAGVSGTNARKSIKSGDKETFFNLLPQQTTPEEKEEIFTILKPAVKESLNERLKPYAFRSSLKENKNHITEYKFKTSKGTEYMVDLINYPKNEVKVEYGAIKEGKKSWIKLTSDGEPLRIISTVTEIIKDYYAKNPLIEVVKWEATKGKNSSKANSQRDKLNLRFFKREIPGIEVVYERKETRVILPKVNELEDKEIAYWATQADIFSFLKKYPHRYKELAQKLSGKRKEALDYFWDNYFENGEALLNENASYSKDIDIKGKIMQLTQHMLDKGYNIEPLPTVEFVDGDSDNARDFFGKTAYYNPNNQTIVLYTEGRHPKDIVRSYAHEMIHHIQNLEGRLGNITTTNTQEDDELNKIEAEANLKGTMTFRNWTDSLNEIGDASAAKLEWRPSRIDVIAREIERKIRRQEDDTVEYYDMLPAIEVISPESRTRYRVTVDASVDKPEDELAMTTLRVDFTTEEGGDNAINKGEQYKILATLTDIIIQLITRVNEIDSTTLDLVKFYAKDDTEGKYSKSDSKRGKLYQAFINKNLSKLPGNWKMSTSDEVIMLSPVVNEGFNKKLGKDPFGLNAYALELARGLEESLNEGRYDNISRQLASIALNSWKSDFKDGASYGYFMGEITPEEYPTDLTFTFKALGRFVDGDYTHNGYSRSDGEVGVKYEIPKDAIPQIWEEVYMDLISTIRHEIEHQTQSGKNVKPGKGMASDQELRKLISKGGSDLVAYVTLPKEIESNVQGLYLKAKKWRRPYDEVADEYIKDFLKITNPADVSYVKNKWQEVAKKRNLPSLLNEGRYDTLANQLSKIAFESFKDIHDRGDREGSFEFRVDHPDDEHDIPSEEFYFDFVGKVEITDDEYEVDGGANAGFDNKGEEITPLLSVKFKIPKNPDWQKVSFDIKDVVRHELEHLTQDGDNVKSGKQMDDDQLIRDLIDADLLPKSQYFKLEKEVDAMLQGLYFKAKKSRTPFKDVANDYLDIFVDQKTISPEEKEQVLDVWRSRIKALSLPVLENKEVMNYTIYLDMDGVLVDFDKQFEKIAKMPPRQYEKMYGADGFWGLIDDPKRGGGVGYWRGMEWMPGGEELYNFASKYNHFLLSSPSRSELSRIGKRMWRKDKTPNTKLILARSYNKKNYADENSILIDDRKDTIDSWIKAGGIGIHYTSAADAIQQLKDLGL